MDTGKTIISFTFSLLTLALFGQENSSIQLEELIIEHQKISNQSKSQRTIVLNDSLIDRNTGTFTEFLQKNSNIYFKENGYGMVSSPSFRGTTAQQTNVLWNGIKINAAFLGQTDFNSTAFKSYDNIVVKPGGGSVLYGSGAIGGTIHLNNQLTFSQPITNEIQMNYGSFNTQGIHYKVSGGTEKWAVNAHFGFNKSANDYEWIGKNRKNTNGQFYNVDFGTEVAYKLNRKNTLAFYSSA
ncbi:MAG TPA: Plug domain-containing protein, partial [Flavobacterium sp.]|nr:Plug domain-containing protein [Flavobacterium sp.]